MYILISFIQMKSLRIFLPKREVFRLEMYQGMVTVSFSAVGVQLDSFGIPPSETSLREQLVDYLQEHPYIHDDSSHFREFILAPVISDDPSNADTEAPSQQDVFISSIENLRVHQQLRWLRYLERLNAGAWGDHTAVQGLADMLHVDIHIISTINPDMELIRTSHDTRVGVVHLGLIGQFTIRLLRELMNTILLASSQQQIKIVTLNPYQKNMTRSSLKIKKHFNIKLTSEDSPMTASCKEKTQSMPQLTMCSL